MRSQIRGRPVKLISEQKVDEAIGLGTSIDRNMKRIHQHNSLTVFLCQS